MSLGKVQRTRLLFYIKDLSGGGAERAVVDLVNSVDRTLFEPKLLLGRETGQYLDLMDPNDVLNPNGRVSSGRGGFATPRGLRRLKAFAQRAAVAFWARWINRNLEIGVRSDRSRRMIQRVVVSNRVRKLAAAIRWFRPDVVVSSLMESASQHVYVARQMELARSPDYKWVAVEQNNARQRFEAWYNEAELPIRHNITTLVYGAADAVVAVSKGVREGLVADYGVDASKISVIHNHVDNDAVASVSPIVRDRPFILAAGRLHVQKNFHALIHAYARIAHRIPEDLIILGEGEERESLEEAVRIAGVEGRVELPGFSADLWSYMKAASCLALSSRFEGLPLTLLEAMAAGCPVVAFDCDYGPREIITDGVNGILVPQGDISALAESMMAVVSDRAFADRLAEGGRGRARDFDREVTTTQYEALFRGLVSP